MKLVLALAAGAVAHLLARLLLASAGAGELAVPAAWIAAVVVTALVLARTLKPSSRPVVGDGVGGPIVGGALLAAGAAALAEAGDSLMGSLADEIGGLGVDAGSFAGSALADLVSDD